MKLRALITIEFETKDIMSAKESIDELQTALKPLEKKYGDITLDIRERRGPKATKRSN